MVGGFHGKGGGSRQSEGSAPSEAAGTETPLWGVRAKLGPEAGIAIGVAFCMMLKSVVVNTKYEIYHIIYSTILRLQNYIRYVYVHIEIAKLY